MKQGAADKAANLARRKSSYRQLPVFGRLVYPVRAEVTKHVLPGCKSLGRPAAVCAAVGTIWEASKFGGLNIKEYLPPRKAVREKSCSREERERASATFVGRSVAIGQASSGSLLSAGSQGACTKTWTQSTLPIRAAMSSAHSANRR